MPINTVFKILKECPCQTKKPNFVQYFQHAVPFRNIRMAEIFSKELPRKMSIFEADFPAGVTC